MYGYVKGIVRAQRNNHDGMWTAKGKVGGRFKMAFAAPRKKQTFSNKKVKKFIRTLKPVLVQVVNDVYNREKPIKQEMEIYTEGSFHLWAQWVLGFVQLVGYFEGEQAETDTWIHPGGKGKIVHKVKPPTEERQISYKTYCGIHLNTNDHIGCPESSPQCKNCLSAQNMAEAAKRYRERKAQEESK